MPTISSKTKKSKAPSPPPIQCCFALVSNQRVCIILVLPCTTLKEEGGGGGRSFCESLHLCFDDREKNRNFCKSRQVEVVVGADYRRIVKSRNPVEVD